MKKKFFFAAVALVALASCANEEIIGDSPTPNPSSGPEKAIVFNSGANAITRADYTGGDAATKLSNNFVVEGVKSDGTATSGDVVFNNYNVNYKANTANTTTSNTANWEYVAQTPHYHGLNTSPVISAQTIKYWDYAKSQYDFIAYSIGGATAVYKASDYNAASNILVSTITPSTMDAADKDGNGTNDGAYSVKGKAANLAKFYIADLVTAYRDATAPATSDYQNTVVLTFRSLSAKVRVALYETVPGYSVKDVVFYTDANTKATDGEAHLYTTGTDVFNEEGTYTIYYPNMGSAKRNETDYNKAHLAFKEDASGTAKDKTFGAFKAATNSTTFEDGEGTEAGTSIYLGRASNDATYAGVTADNYYTIVIPNETGADLNLKVDYTLVSTDGSGETIKVTGATALVPKQYATWKSGYAYTYLFKISQNTNGLTNPDINIAGLYPITFDAVVLESDDHVQETITTVSTPSITTYAKGEVVTGKNEYTTGSNIYVVVEGTPVLTPGTNANLYTVTLESGAAQTINEASVANAIKNGGAASPFVVTDANGKKMTVTAASGLTLVTEIDADDSPNGNAIPINGAKFTPAAPTYTLAALTAGDSMPTDATYYEKSGDVYTPTSDATVAAKAYYTRSSGAGTYVFEYIDGLNKYYKIINVVDP